MSPHAITPIQARRRRGFTPWRLVVGVFTTLGVLAIGIGAVSPEAHRHVHEDACLPEHVCAITLAAVGFCDTAMPVLVPAPDAQSPGIVLPAPESFVWTRPGYWLTPAHAPPACAA